jgi:four helix bundle protein
MTDKVSSYKDLKVWLKGMEIVDETYKLIKDFPKEEIYALASQIRRSAVSIPSNIAEGWGRDSSLSYKQFLRISRGSLFELETQLEIAKRQGMISETAINKIEGLITEESKMLTAFINSIKDKK